MLEKKCPECLWVPVKDGSGRRHMEMRWSVAALRSAAAAVKAA